MALGIFSDDCICTALCGAVLGSFNMRKLREFQACAFREDIGME